MKKRVFFGTFFVTNELYILVHFGTLRTFSHNVSIFVVLFVHLLFCPKIFVLFSYEIVTKNLRKFVRHGRCMFSYSYKKKYVSYKRTKKKSTFRKIVRK